jgi:hypothetical protein
VGEESTPFGFIPQAVVRGFRLRSLLMVHVALICGRMSDGLHTAWLGGGFPTGLRGWVEDSPRGTTQQVNSACIKGCKSSGKLPRNITARFKSVLENVERLCKHSL